MSRRMSFITVAMIIVPLILALGCGEYGKVDQGRVVDFDKEKGKCTIIKDQSSDPKNPDYSSLPPVVYEIPDDPQEMGPEPNAGLRMKLDTEKKQITIFDTAAQSFKTLDYAVIDQKENVEKENPLVYDNQKKEPKKFPVVDREKKTITLYSKRQKILVTFSLPDEYFALPDYTWDAGDEVRIYYKKEGKAQRFMNISKTDIYKK